MKHLFDYERTLKELKEGKYMKPNGLKVFSCFSCGGGSTMGYKLAGFDVIGCNEIDPRMMKTYKANNNPKHSFLMPIQEFKNLKEYPSELYDLDILDGSPPCSSFSMAGNRDKDWGKEKKFREGQANQVLDTLFFDFIELAGKLQPKVIIAENVKGLLIGDAFDYVQEIYKAYDAAGYHTDHFLLNGADMGVPQARERVFFISVRKDLKDIIKQKDMFHSGPNISLKFNEETITYGQIENKVKEEQEGYHIPAGVIPFWEQIEPGRSCADVHPKGHFFQELKLDPNKPLPTLRAGSNSYYHYEKPRRLFDDEIVKGGSFPTDYNFCGSKAIYIVGMSVPPVMMANVAHQVNIQLLNMSTL